MWLSAWLASWAAIWASSALIWVFRLASTAARARVTWALAAPASPVAPRGADVSPRAVSDRYDRGVDTASRSSKYPGLSSGPTARSVSSSAYPGRAQRTSEG